MAPAANKVNIKPSTNLPADIFSSLLWVLLTDESDGNPACRRIMFGIGAPVKLESSEAVVCRNRRQGNEDLRCRARVQRRATAARLALQHPRGHGSIRPSRLGVRAHRV